MSQEHFYLLVFVAVIAVVALGIAWCMRRKPSPVSSQSSKPLSSRPPLLEADQGRPPKSDTLCPVGQDANQAQAAILAMEQMPFQVSGPTTDDIYEWRKKLCAILLGLNQRLDQVEQDRLPVAAPSTSSLSRSHSDPYPPPPGEKLLDRIGVGYSQESTRFCAYASEKFGNQIRIIDPSEGLAPEQLARRHKLYEDIEAVYNAESAEGVPAQIARGVLPTALKTQLGVTNDFRAWRWFLAMRTSKKAHPQIRELAFCIWDILIKKCPVIFETIPTVEERQRLASEEFVSYTMREDLCINRAEALAA